MTLTVGADWRSRRTATRAAARPIGDPLLRVRPITTRSSTSIGPAGVAATTVSPDGPAVISGTRTASRADTLAGSVRLASGPLAATAALRVTGPVPSSVTTR